MSRRIKSVRLVFVFVISMALLCFAPAGFAKKGGNGGGKPGGEEPPPVDPSCAGYDSDFPAFAYTVRKTNRKGGTGYDFYLSNADADCEVLVHTSDWTGNDLEFSYSQNGTKGVIVWKQAGNEYAGRKDDDRVVSRIKMLQFETSNKEVMTSLPLASSEVALVTPGSGPTGRNSFRYIDLSMDGSTVLVSHGDNINYPGSTVNSIREIDISTCSSNCEMSEPLFTTTEHITIGLGYSPSMDRIYFTGKYRDDSSDDLAGQYYVAFIEYQEGGSWTNPRFVTLSGNGYHGTPSYFRQPDVAVVDLGNGSFTELLGFHYSQYNSQDPSVIQIIDVGICTATGNGDCLSAQESSIEYTIFDGRNVSFDNKFNPTKLFFSSSEISSDQEIIEYEFSTGSEKSLAFGFQADSGN